MMIQKKYLNNLKHLKIKFLIISKFKYNYKIMFMEDMALIKKFTKINLKKKFKSLMHLIKKFYKIIQTPKNIFKN